MFLSSGPGPSTSLSLSFSRCVTHKQCSSVFRGPKQSNGSRIATDPPQPPHLCRPALPAPQPVLGSSPECSLHRPPAVDHV
ncbi:hypothetical protein KUCAC02_005770 [Chaenocephalus aceratus]|uniref:Uncharacterized protein n=1 Tax=Chaenocephalus aceratus TaxID=36190 RepID=A0ACB9WRB4_CHAAC|nr:hypothetical protein KUCAC02_005770 [Chaenocephalus aceratus]